MLDPAVIATRFIAACNGDKDLALIIIAELLQIYSVGFSPGMTRLTKEGKEFVDKFERLLK